MSHHPNRFRLTKESTTNWFWLTMFINIAEHGVNEGVHIKAIKTLPFTNQYFTIILLLGNRLANNPINIDLGGHTGALIMS